MVKRSKKMTFTKITKMMALVAVAAAFAGCQQNNGPATGDNVMEGGMAPWGQGCSNTIYFDFDKSDIRPEYRDCLQKGGAYLQANAGAKLTIEGNTDERGTPEYNMALGERRAQSVVSALMAAGGKAGQAEAVSYGEERPAVDGHDESAWAKNRRAVITGK
jgi:peptidoglycan-associated lipoprotein